MTATAAPTPQLISVTVTPVNDNNPVVHLAQHGQRRREHHGGDDGHDDRCRPAGSDGRLLGQRRGGCGPCSRSTAAATWPFLAAPDYESPADFDGDNVYEVEVTADDGNGGHTAQLISVTVTPVNDNNPVFTSPSTANVAENTTAVMTVTTTDADLPAQTVGLLDQRRRDGALFTIDGSGNLAFSPRRTTKSPSDFDGDNVYEVEVTADDGNGGTTAQLISVTVKPVNDNNPVFTSPATANVAENTTAVMTVTPRMPTCRLRRSATRSAAARMAPCSRSTAHGDLSFLAAPDYEAPADFDGDNVYEVEVTADDNAGTRRRS